VSTERPADLVLTTDQNWAARSHRELYDAVHQNNDPGKSGEIGWHWEQFGAGLTESAQIIDKELTATEHGWTGASADAARAAIRSLAQWVTQTAHDATDVGARIQEQSRIVEAARAAMPEPAEFDWDAATGTLSGPGIASFAASAADVQAANEKARAAHEQAVAVMTEMERQSRAVDETTPHFTAPFNPTTGQVEKPEVITPAATGAESLRAVGAPEHAAPASGESPPPAHLGGTTAEREYDQQMLTASASVPSGHFGAISPGPSEHGSHTGQHSTVHAGTPGTAAAAAAAAAGMGVGAYARRGGGRPSDESSIQATPGVPGGTDAFPVTPGAEPTLGAPPPSTGQPPPRAMPPRPGGPPQGFGTAGGKSAAARAGGFGGSGGAMPGTPGMPGMPGMAKGRPQDGDITLAPGKSAGTTDFADGPASAGSSGTTVPGAGSKSTTDAAGMPMGGAPPGGGMARSPDAEDTEHKTAYVQSEDIFAPPGDDLPPPVIGGRKTPKKAGDSS
jgi:hypothetical protein